MKKIALFFAFSLWMLLSSHYVIFSQTENKETRWTRIASPKGDLTFSLPPDFLIDNEGEDYRAIGYLNDATMNVSIEVTGNAQNRLNSMRQYSDGTKSTIARFTLDKITGDVYTLETEKVFSVTVYAASPKEFYTITAVSKNSTNAAVLDFLNSIQMSDRPLLKQNTQPAQTNEPRISIASLKTSPLILEVLKRKDAPKLKIKYELEKGNISTIDQNIEDSAKYSRSLIILRKPRAKYTDSGRRNGVTGTIKLRAVFHANGAVGEIVILRKLGSGLDEEAANAARKIKFLPAEIDNKPVDETKIIEYGFAIY